MTPAVGPPVDPQQPGSRGLLALTSSVLGWRAISMAAVAVAAVITARELGPAGRGSLLVVLTLTAVGVALGSGGIHFSGRVHLVSTTAAVGAGSYAGLAVVLAVVLGLASSALGAFALPYANVHGGWTLALALGISSTSLLLQFLLVEELHAFGFTTRAAAVDAWSSSVQLVLVAVVAAAGEATPVSVLVAFTASNVLGILAGVAVLRRAGVDVRPRCRFADWRLLLRAGRAGLTVGLAELLLFRLDRYLIAVLLLPSAVGIYGAAATAPELLRVPVAAVAQPVFYRLAVGSAVIGDFRRMRWVVLAGTAAMVLAMAAVAPAAVDLVFGPAYREAVTPLRILLLSEFGVALFYFDGSALAGLGRTRETAWAAALGLAITAAGDLALIPAYGLAGAAWASVAGYSVMGLVTHHCLLRRTLPADPSTASAP